MVIFNNEIQIQSQREKYSQGNRKTDLLRYLFI